MNATDRIIKELVYSASGRFSACETQQDFVDQQRLYEALLRERIEDIVQIRLAASREEPEATRPCAECGQPLDNLRGVYLMQGGGGTCEVCHRGCREKLEARGYAMIGMAKGTRP